MKLNDTVLGSTQTQLYILLHKIAFMGIVYATDYLRVLETKLNLFL